MSDRIKGKRDTRSADRGGGPRQTDDDKQTDKRPRQRVGGKKTFGGARKQTIVWLAAARWSFANAEK
eukprot:EW704385.1.p2 GENE.EW704385.1~~EW704385.1.p2  ORF type:complete len:67 (-),score=9.10 EW704385.1:89-289(-)